MIPHKRWKCLLILSHYVSLLGKWTFAYHLDILFHRSLLIPDFGPSQIHLHSHEFPLNLLSSSISGRLDFCLLHLIRGLITWLKPKSSFHVYTDASLITLFFLTKQVSCFLSNCLRNSQSLLLLTWVIKLDCRGEKCWHLFVEHSWRLSPSVRSLISSGVKSSPHKGSDEYPLWI